MVEDFEIGVVVACYKGERTLAETLASVRAQTHRGWRLIVVDDGSPDNVAGIAASLAVEDARITVVRIPNGGVCGARNTGFARLPETVRYVMFLDQDDVLGAAALKELAAVLEAHPEAGLVHCEPRLIDVGGHEIAKSSWMPRWAFIKGRVVALAASEDGVTPFESIYCAAGVLPSLSLYRRSVLVQAGLYDVELGQCYEDVNLNIAVALRSEVRHVAKRLVDYRIHPAQVSADEARVRSQEARLYGKWTTRTDLSTRDAARIAAAERFRTGRLAVRLELIGAKRELKAGRFAGFWRHGLAAVKLATSR